VTTLQAVQIAAAVLALALLLGTVARRMAPFGRWRRGIWDAAILLGCAAPVLALVGPYLQGRIWPGAAIVAAGFGGFHLIRSLQLRRADRDRLRVMLGLSIDASYGEMMQQVERIEPQPITGQGKLVLAVGAALLLLIGQLLGRFELAVVALLIGVADGTVRGAYHRALARKARAIGR
jgi:hypothetical protein